MILSLLINFFFYDKFSNSVLIVIPLRNSKIDSFTDQSQIWIIYLKSDPIICCNVLQL